MEFVICVETRIADCTADIRQAASLIATPTGDTGKTVRLIVRSATIPYERGYGRLP
jgi:hypothetical protein